MPVYIIQASKGTPVIAKRLVRANSRAQAIRFVAESMFACEVATGETVADLMRVGFPCEDARAPETAELPLEMGDKPTSGNSGSHTDQSTPSSGGPLPAADPYLDARRPPDEIDTVLIEGIDHVS